MNIWEFRKLWFSLFDYKAMNKIAANLKVEYDDNGGNDGGHTIEVFDKNTRVAYMDFDVNSDYKGIYVELVFVADRYSSHNLALRMFKEFYKNYKSKWWGYTIHAEFANAELSKFFADAVAKGWFPEGVNQTEDMNLTDEEFKGFKGRMNDGVNDKIDLVGDIPEPIMRDTEHGRRHILTGYDIVYKNLTKQQYDNLQEYYGNFRGNNDTSIMFDGGSDVYLGFFKNSKPNMDVISKLAIKLAFYVRDNEIATTDLNLVKQYMNVMQQYNPQLPNGGTIYLYSNGLYNGDTLRFKFNSVEEIDDIIQENKVAFKSRLRRINGGKL